MDKFLTPEELEHIANACRALDPLWEVVTSKNGTLEVEMLDAPVVEIRNGAGEKVGVISWGDDGGAFYLEVDDKVDDK